MTQINLPPEDEQQLMRLVATEVDHKLAQTNPAEYRKQVAGVIDTALNRMASGQFPDDLTDVANQRRQFSKITGPARLNPYGSIEETPDSVIPDVMLQPFQEHLAARKAGERSSVGGNLHYANPNFSDAKNREWIDKLEGPTFGAGQRVHKHGTTQGFYPMEAQFQDIVPPPRPSDEETGSAQAQAVNPLMQPFEKGDIEQPQLPRPRPDRQKDEGMAPLKPNPFIDGSFDAVADVQPPDVLNEAMRQRYVPTNQERIDAAFDAAEQNPGNDDLSKALQQKFLPPATTKVKIEGADPASMAGAAQLPRDFRPDIAPKIDEPQSDVFDPTRSRVVRSLQTAGPAGMSAMEAAGAMPLLSEPTPPPANNLVDRPAPTPPPRSPNASGRRSLLSQIAPTASNALHDFGGQKDAIKIEGRNRLKNAFSQSTFGRTLEETTLDDLRKQHGDALKVGKNGYAYLDQGKDRKDRYKQIGILSDDDARRLGVKSAREGRRPLKRTSVFRNPERTTKQDERTPRKRISLRSIFGL